MKPPARKAQDEGSGVRPGTEKSRVAGHLSGYSPHEWGCVHGRFQPFHNGHLEYVLRAKARCRRLVVGITNPDPVWVRAEASSPHRHEPEANPFTYFERALMVRDALLEGGMRPREFLVVPFPIHDLDLLRHYVPPTAVHFVRVYSEWEQEKVNRLRARGLVVEVLDPGKEKEFSGSVVRGLMRSGRPWEHLVPDGAAEVARRSLAAARSQTKS